MNLGIIGSRTFNNYNLLKESIEKFDNISLIISGGAKGADNLAYDCAKEMNIETLIIKPDWKKYNRGAGLIRNKDIVDKSDFIIAFWDGQSKGTLHAIKYAKKKRKKFRDNKLFGEKMNTFNEIEKYISY